MAKRTMEIQIPFGKAGDPVQETSQFGRIPEGTYLATVHQVNGRETQNGDPMVSIDLQIDTAPAVRKHVSDVFVIQSGKGASLFAVQRLNGVLVASGIKAQTKTASLAAVVKNLEGRQLCIEVVDHTIPETEEYSAKETSKPSGYYRLDSEEAERVAGAAPADDDEGGDQGEWGEGDGDEDEDGRPKRKSSKSKSKSKQKDEDADGDGDGDGCDDEDCEIEDCDGDHDGDGDFDEDGGDGDGDSGDGDDDDEPPKKKKGKKKSRR